MGFFLFFELSCEIETGAQCAQALRMRYYTRCNIIDFVFNKFVAFYAFNVHQNKKNKRTFSGSESPVHPNDQSPFPVEQIWGMTRPDMGSEDCKNQMAWNADNKSTYLTFRHQTRVPYDPSLPDVCPYNRVLRDLTTKQNIFALSAALGNIFCLLSVISGQTFEPYHRP